MTPSPPSSIRKHERSPLNLVSSSSKYSRAIVTLLVLLITLSAQAAAPSLTIPQDAALRIRLDDTLTSNDSQVNDPFSATVVAQGPYEGARVYGHISSIDMSGHLQGRTEMILHFDRLIMFDGRTARIHAEIIQIYHAPSHA